MLIVPSLDALQEMFQTCEEHMKILQNVKPSLLPSSIEIEKLVMFSCVVSPFPGSVEEFTLVTTSAASTMVGRTIFPSREQISSEH